MVSYLSQVASCFRFYSEGAIASGAMLQPVVNKIPKGDIF